MLESSCCTQNGYLKENGGNGGTVARWIPPTRAWSDAYKPSCNSLSPPLIRLRHTMLAEPTLEKLYAMKLNGLAEAWQEQQQQPQSSDLSFDERLAMLVERQWIWKENRALVTRLKFAQLKQSACLEDIDYRHPRGLKRAAVEQLASCDWIRHHRHCIITGPTGVGKSYLACALAHQACRERFRALYFYAPKLFRDLNLAQADGSLIRLLKRLARVDLLVIDDWGMTPLTPEQ